MSIIRIAAAGAVALVFISGVAALTFRETVQAGEVAIRYNLYGDEKGVTGETVGPGRYWLTWNERLFKMPTVTKTVVWTADNRPGSETNEQMVFQDREGTSMSADVGAAVRIDPTKAPILFQKFRRGLDEIADTYVYNLIRTEVNTLTSKKDAADIYGQDKEAIFAQASKNVAAELAPLGIIVERIYLLSNIRVPETVVAGINKKLVAQQAAQTRENDIATAKAQAQIEREKAQGEADARIIEAKGVAAANNLVNASLTPMLIEMTKAQRWNGVQPNMLVTDGNRSTLLLGTPK